MNTDRFNFVLVRVSSSGLIRPYMFINEVPEYNNQQGLRDQNELFS